MRLLRGRHAALALVVLTLLHAWPVVPKSWAILIVVGVTTSIEGPLRAFHGDNFEVGIRPMLAAFVVSETPHQEGGSWVMVVDRVKLVRTAGSESDAIRL